jgi:tetratricopeptide (TPR) repeat protein
MVAMVRANLGDLKFSAGDLHEARKSLEAALALNREIGNRVWEAQNLEVLGSVALRAGDHGSASRLLQESLELSIESGFETGAAASRVELATLALREKRFAEALQMLQAAVRTYSAAGKAAGTAQAVRQAGTLAALLYEGKLAARLWGASRAIPDSADPDEDLRDLMDRSRAELVSDVFDSSLSEGRKLSAAEACSLVLQLHVDSEDIKV